MWIRCCLLFALALVFTCEFTSVQAAEAKECAGVNHRMNSQTGQCECIPPFLGSDCQFNICLLCNSTTEVCNKEYRSCDCISGFEHVGNSIKCTKTPEPEPNTDTKDTESKGDTKDTESKGAPEPEPNTAPEPEPNTAPEPEPNTDTKDTESKGDPEPETNTDTKDTESKGDTKDTESKGDTKDTESKGDTKDTECKEEPEPETNTDTKDTESMGEPEPEPNTDTKDPESMGEPEPERNTDTKDTESKEEPEPGPNTDTKDTESKGDTKDTESKGDTKDTESKGEKVPTVDGSASIDTDTDGSKSTHFLAYFLVSVVLCIAGYVVYHNRKKLMGLVVEGSSTRKGRGGRPSSKDYSRLEEHVSDTLSKGQGKTYIF